MAQDSSKPPSKDRSRLLKVFGVLLLLIGFFFAFVGMVEMYCFYLFAEGGRFHYEGFGFGTFMFANIATQIAGYYVIAVIGIVLGAGHLGLKRWAHDLSLTLFVSWLIVGLPLTLIALLMFITAKDPTAISFLLALPFAALVYPVAPFLLMRFYRSRAVCHTFEQADPHPSWLADIPLPVRVLCVLMILNILTLHGMVLLNGLFPFFGVLFIDLHGIMALDVLFLLLGILTWGLARLKLWAWWGTLIIFAALTVSTLVTLPRYTVGSILDMMAFAPIEMDAFSNLPFLSASPTLAAVLPLLTMLGLIGWTYRHFRGAVA
ncbi:MAG: hypothetical protein JXB30_07805 [Anaerolineae bacterium]|nr:hypothetical protein [Anaerolineae bacterium]